MFPVLHAPGIDGVDERGNALALALWRSARAAITPGLQALRASRKLALEDLLLQMALDQLH